ncbi:MAG: hypothetical protein J7M25_06705 [Deltaproteobacteria bacterium]|nr:hypothetical protein [Deltaproteobacteria bacterium]
MTLQSQVSKRGRRITMAIVLASSVALWACGGHSEGGGGDDGGLNNNQNNNQNNNSNAVCGNSVIEGDELCDASDLGSASCASLNLGTGSLACTDGCVFDTSDCSKQASCGNALIEYPETCDGTDLGGATCASEGFVDGDVTCNASCQLDTSGCNGCGNGVVDEAEECDGEDFGGQTCQSLGLVGGDLTCTADCRYDTSGCMVPPECGNGTAEPGEECDGTDVKDNTCDSTGHGTGTLGCDGDCRLDFSGCVWCGNGVMDAGEECDGTDLGTATCDSEGFGPGNLSCDTTCHIVTSGCSLCGNGLVDNGEECDGTNLNSTTCADRGYDAGDLTCDATCHFDESGCTTCGTSDVTPPTASNHVPDIDTQGAPRDTNIEADLFDACGIDTTSITMRITITPKFGPVHTQNVTPNVTGSGTNVHVAYDPPSDFSMGAIVEVALTASDVDSNTLTDTWRFSVVDNLLLTPGADSGTGPLDNGIDEAQPDTNFYRRGTYPVGGTSGAEKRYIIRYRPTLPPGALILRATFTLGVCEPGGPSSATQVDCYRLNVVSRPSNSTWNTRSNWPGPTALWATPGADGVPTDREGTAAVSVAIPTNTAAYTPFTDDVTGLVADWEAGAGYFGIICMSASATPVPICSSYSNYSPNISVTFGPALP